MSPSKETVCGLPLALSLTETVPKLKELDGGIHLTVMVQDFPAPRFVSQSFVSEKAAPVIPMPVMLNVVLPKLVSVGVASVWHSHPSPIIFLQAKIRLVGDRVAFGPETTPVPLKATDCGLPGALSAIDNVPVRVPICVGLNVTLIVQLARGATLEPQLWVWLKSRLAVMLVMLSVVLPKLVSVTDFPGLVVPTSWAAKVTPVGDKVAFGPETTPVPLREAICGLPAALSETLSAALRNPDVVGLNVTLIVQLAPAANELPQVWV